MQTVQGVTLPLDRQEPLRPGRHLLLLLLLLLLLALSRTGTATTVHVA
jgi:hypothetical protein